MITPDIKTQLLSLLIPAEAGTTGLNFDVRETDNPSIIYIPGTNVGLDPFKLTLNGTNRIADAATLSPLSSMVSGFQWRLRLETAQTSGADITFVLRIS